MEIIFEAIDLNIANPLALIKIKARIIIKSFGIFKGFKH